MSFDLVSTGALSKLFDLINTVSTSLIPFAESIIEFMTQPIATAIQQLFAPLFDIAVIGELLSFFTSSLLTAIFGTMTVPQFIFGAGITFYLVYTIGKWVTNLFI